MASSPKTASSVPIENTSGQLTKVTAWLQNLETLVEPAILDRDLTAPPSSPTDGDAYIPAATATGDWTGDEKTIQVYYNGWVTLTPTEGWRVYVSDENLDIFYDGTDWIELPLIGSITDSITASTTHTQGQGPLTASINRVTTVAVANDTVTLMAAAARTEQTVINDGANTLQVFPASGDQIDVAAVDAAVTLLAGERAEFKAIDATRWISFVSNKA